MQVTFESPRQPEVIALIAALDAYQDELYPAEARHALSLDALAQPDVLFAVARDAQGTAVGCGAVVLTLPDGELKRLYVQPEHRARGTASLILATLEAAAALRGCRVLRLETGPRQPEALAFYAKHGYARCDAFGGYPEHPLSVFLHKTLATA